ncbi:MAG: transketolase family protein, partial [Thermoplasmata archaeon]|nr:transketolase family protein [Thermoplasmata archaeon]
MTPLATAVPSESKASSTPESLLDAFAQTLRELAVRNPSLVVVEAEAGDASLFKSLRESGSARYLQARAVESTTFSAAAATSTDRPPVFATGFDVFTADFPYHLVRESVSRDRTNLKIVSSRAGLLSRGKGVPVPMLEDIGLMRGLPGMTVLVPADAPSTRSAIRAVGETDGPAYVRLAPQPLPTVTQGHVAIGQANEIRAGSDLTIIAIGALVSRALEVAEELHRVGIGARVIDLASVKPFDEKAVLRAARDTGAILTMEDHSVLTGLGCLVAAAT